jgi:hypothetical protein
VQQSDGLGPSIHTHRVFEPGCRRLSGDEALDLLRQLRGLVGTHLEGDEVPVVDRTAPGVSYLAVTPAAAGLFEALRADDLGRWFADKRRR